MTRTQQYLLTMLDRMPVWELAGDGPRSMMDRIKERLASNEDMQPELKSLFRVRGFSEFALGLLWIVDKVDRDPTRLESTEDEEKFVFTHFRKAMAAAGPMAAVQEEPLSTAPDPGFARESAQHGTGVHEPVPEPRPTGAREPGTADFQQDAGVPLPTPPTPPSTGDPNHPETEFAQILERFVEALQTGSDQRSPLLKELVTRCDGMAAQETAGDDLKQFAFRLQDLLHYIEDNQLLDDTRAMNVITNAQEPFLQWAHADATSRAGMLDHALEILRDARLMLE